MNTSYIAATLGFDNDPNNIETVYNKRLQKYFFDHSRNVNYITDADDLFILEYDPQGNITNAEFDKTYKTGVPIVETDFVNQQLNKIDKVDTKGLKQEHKALLAYYKEYLNTKLNVIESQKIKNNKFPEKLYALYQWILIDMGKAKPFEKNRITDTYDKPAIMKFGVEQYKLKTTGQGFYNTFINTDITSKTAIAKEYGKGYKEKLIEISNNDADVISYLRNYPK